MSDNGKAGGMIIGGLIAAAIIVPVWIYDHVRTKNKYYSLGKEDGYVEATIACEVKYRKQAQKIREMKGKQEKINAKKDALIEKILHELEEAKDELEKMKVKSSENKRYVCLSGAVCNFAKTLKLLRVA